MGKVYSRDQVHPVAGGQRLNSFKSLQIIPGTGKRVPSNDNSAGEIIWSEKNPSPATIEIVAEQTSDDHAILQALEELGGFFTMTVEKTLDGKESVMVDCKIPDLPQEGIEGEVGDVTWQVMGKLTKHEIYGS